MGHDKSRYIPINVYSRSTQRCMNVHVSLSVIHTIYHINTRSHCMTTVVKMVGRSVNQKDDIRAYIKALLKLGCSFFEAADY